MAGVLQAMRNAIVIHDRSEGEPIAVLPFRLVPAGQERSLVLSRHGHSLLVPRTVGEALLSCRSFRTVAAHFGSAANSGILRAADETAFRESIGSLIESGAAEKFSTVVSRAQGVGPDVPKREIRTLAMVSCDRPHLAQRALRSFARNALQYGRRLTMVIYDDSQNPRNINNYRVVAADIAAEFGLEVRHAGWHQRSNFAKSLATHVGLASNTTTAALLGNGPTDLHRGANTNSAFLDLCGENFLSIDDDLTCDVGTRSAPGDGGITFTSTPGPVKSFAYPDWASLGVDVRPENIDYIGLHESILGRSLSAVLQETGNIDAASATADCFGLDAGTPPYVGVTCGAFYGDSGSEIPSYLLFSPNETIRAFLGGEDYYESVVRSRLVWRGVPRFTIGHSRFIQATNLGVSAFADGARIIPPFLPWFRCSDNIFGEMLAQCRPDIRIGYLHQGIRHDPWPPRKDKRDDVWRLATKVRFYDVFSALLAVFSRSAHAGSGETWLRSFADFLRASSTLGTCELQRLLFDVLAERAARRICELEEVLRKHRDAPAWWRKDVERYLQMKTHWIDEGVLCFSEESLARNGGPPVIFPLLSQFADVLESWPAMIKGSQDLRSMGIRPSEVVAPNGP